MTSKAAKGPAAKKLPRAVKPKLHRVQIELTHKEVENLKRMMLQYDARSYTELLRRSIRAYQQLNDADEAGTKVYTRDPEGRELPVLVLI